MKKNLLQQLTEANNLDELNLGLDMTDIQYIRSVTAYAVNQGVGLMEAEIIRKDLIGMAGEAKKEGELLNQRLGDVKEFAKDLAIEGKRGNRKDRVYSSLETVGLIYLLGGLLVFVMYFLIGEMEALESGFFNLMYLIWLLLIDFSDIAHASVHFVSLHMERCYAIFKDDTFPLGIPYYCRFRRGIILVWKDKV